MMYRSSIFLIAFSISLLGAKSAYASAYEGLDITAVPFEQLLETDFIPASYIAKQISEAPSAVSIVTDQDIHDYGYRTLADILNSMPGLYTSSSLLYDYLGGRGFGSPGDYAGRIMLVIDGYVANENFYNQVFLGEDALLNVDLIKQVEFIPGPGSTTYGNSAFLGVINIITKRGRDFDGAQAAIDLGENDEQRTRITYGKQFDNDAELLFSVSEYGDDGRSIYFSELDDWGEMSGQDYTNQVISPIKATSAQRQFLKVSYDGFTLEAANSEKKTQSNGFISFLDANDLSLRDITSDKSRFLQLTYDAELSEALKLTTSLYTGNYKYQADMTTAYDVEFEMASTGKWRGIDFKFVGTWFDQQRILFGAEYRDDYRQDFLDSVIDPEYDYSYLFREEMDAQTSSLYIQDEYQASDNLTLIPGIRLDKNSELESSTSPRFALIYQANPDSTLKFSYGRAFRFINPWEELFIADSSETDKESVDTVELVWQQQLASKSRLTASIYQNEISDAFVSVYDSLKTQGLELGIEHVTLDSTRVKGSIVYQETEDNDGDWWINSPRWLAKLHVAKPVLENTATLGLELLAKGRRLDVERNNVAEDWIANLTLSSNRLLPNTDIRFRIGNLFDTEQQDVLSDRILKTMPQDERKYWVQLEYNFR